MADNGVRHKQAWRRLGTMATYFVALAALLLVTTTGVDVSLDAPISEALRVLR